jgi:magnesium transporter
MRSTLFTMKKRKSGIPPGSLVYMGDHIGEKIRLTVFDYNEKSLAEKEVDSVEDLFPFRDTSTVSWINVDGLDQVEVVEKLGSHFGIHHLTLEDIVNTEQRPKMEDMGEYIFIILKMMSFNREENRVESEQVSFIIGDSFVLTFQERFGDVFDTIRERIRNAKGRIRKMGPDYLAYTLMDAVADNYFMVLEEVGEQIENLENEILENPSAQTMQKLQKIKRRLLMIRKSVWPLREVISSLERCESVLLKKQMKPYFRDLYDHTIQVVEMVETMRDMNSGMFDMYMSSISNRMNEIMKVLTIIATIFIPLTFIAGIYGMNFEIMPELKWPFGYFLVCGIMILVAACMVIYFMRKRWL